MQVGDVIANRFRLEAQAGAGGMGVVFRARDLQQSEQWVAVKAWRNEASAQPERFLREAGALAQLRDPAVVGHVQHGVSDAGEPYLAMDWIEGPTLAERLETGGLTPLETIELAARVLQGLAALHAAGIVHRDLKPSNLMLPGGEARAVRILDLGVARLADASELTLAGTRLGTPRYMAPEQIRDPRHVDGRADVFALGCIVFECLCGQPAFGGDDPIAVMAQILFGTPPPVSELRAELPEALDRLLSRLLVRRRELRPEAGPELQAELRALHGLDALPAPARLPPSASMLATIAAADTQVAVSFERTSSPALFGRARRASYAAGDTCPSTPLIGRARELNELSLWMQDTRAITLWGGAGVGKTRLAHELSRLATSRLLVPPEGVVFCELARARDSRDVARIAAEQLGALAAQTDAEDQLGWLFAKLGPMLLVLDRAEHLSRELEPLIRLWTRHAPELRVLVTSRVRLRSTREYELGPLAHRARGQALAGAARLPLTAAGELVLSLAARSVPAPPVVTPERSEQAEAIASALDGNPLAIELALARLPLLGFQGIVERLTGQLELLAERGNATTMRRAIAWSWELLTPAERAAFMQCSVFAGAFSLRAAEAVIALPDGAGSTLDAVHSLREQSLLGGRSAGSAMRLSMPAAVREFAAERMAEHPELADVIERHAAYCGSGEEVIEPEDLVAAAEHSLGAGANPGRALACVLALEPQLTAAGIGGRWSALLTRAIEACPQADLPLLRARQLRARLLAPAGELLRARRELEEVLREAERRGDAALRGTTLLDLGVTHHFARELSEARAYYERALDVLGEIDAPIAEARCYGNLGAVDHDQARLHEAAEGYRRALALLPEGSQERLVANFESNLALVEHELGRLARARELYASAVGRLELLLDARLLGIVLGNFGGLALAERAHAEAHEHFARAAALLAQSGDRRSEGLSLARLGACCALMGRLPEAEQRAVRAERLLRKDALGRAVAALLSAFGDVQGARRALGERQLMAAVACAERAQAKHGAALPLREQSDDLRLYLALLEPQLTELGEQLRAAS